MCRWSTLLNGGRWYPNRVFTVPSFVSFSFSSARALAFASPTTRSPTSSMRRASCASRWVSALADVTCFRGHTRKCARAAGFQSRNTTISLSTYANAEGSFSASAILAQKTHVSGRGARSSSGARPHVWNSSRVQTARPMAMGARRGEGRRGPRVSRAGRVCVGREDRRMDARVTQQRQTRMCAATSGGASSRTSKRGGWRFERRDGAARTLWN
mmetsp:Transcript_276/g.1058  ORF Transcript_276/g.1058 Transcript_276/m.1058 type:complete len:214 (+) Transcript_276:1465-2106(+)